MITEKPQLYWYRTKCFIEGNVVCEVSPHDRVAYDAFEKSNLLNDFININENNLDEIKDFIEKYGFLKAEFSKEVGTIVKSNGEWSWAKPYSESLKDIQNEISTIKALRVLHNAYNSDDPIKTFVKNGSGILTYILILSEVVSQNKNYLEIEFGEEGNIKDIRRKPQEYFEGMEYSTKPYYSDLNVKVSAINILINILNKKIERAKPALNLDIDFKLTGSWRIDSLVDLIYIQFYNTLLSGEELRICENERCQRHRYFKVEVGKEKRFCCRECAVQGMQNETNRSIKDPSSDYYNPKKVAFKKVYGRLYYLDYKKSIDTVKFKAWNKEARENLKVMSEKDYLEWLESTGNEENFIKKKEANKNDR